MAVLIVSFTTRPGHGSEGGVGWQFLRAWAKFGERTQTPIHAVIDSRDEQEVRLALNRDDVGAYVDLYAIAAPAWVPAKIYGTSRSRMSYVAWRINAQRTVRKLTSAYVYDAFHQCTFATGSLPPLVVTDCPNRIWGPITIPTAPVRGRDKRISIREHCKNAAGRLTARRYGRKFDLILAQNEHTVTFFERSSVHVSLEPNIFCSPQQEVERDTGQIVFVGRLIDRKRPWVPIQCLAQPPLLKERLLIVGEGPLRSQLQNLATELGVSERVTFLGQRSHSETLSALSTAGVLILPSFREGAPWVVGEANASGVPAVVAKLSGAETVLRLSGAGYGIAVSEQINDSAFVEEYARVIKAVLETCANPLKSTDRWDPDRLDGLLARLAYAPDPDAARNELYK